MPVCLSALPDYEPPSRPLPPGPDEPDDLPALVPLRFTPPSDSPVWDEPGADRDRLWRLLRLLLEVLDGRRQVDQVRGLVDTTVHQALSTRCRTSGTTGRQHRLRTLHTCRPSPTTIEACATVTVHTPTNHHTIAIAARIIQVRGSLVCTVFRPLYPTRP